MAVTLFVDKKLADVAIVRWFRDPNVNVDYASGPVVHIPLVEFRDRGYQWIQSHFVEYLRIRLPENKVVKVFQPGEARKLMKGRDVVDISRDPDGNLIISAKRIERYDLAGLVGLHQDSLRTISEKSPPDVFWKAFDDVMSIAGGK